MKAHAVLDANTTANLIAIKRTDVLNRLFGTVLMTNQVRDELLEAGYTRDWASKPPDWVKLQDPEHTDPKILEYNKLCAERRERGEGNVRGIDQGETSAISLAKEISKEEGHAAIVVSDERIVRDFLNAEGAGQKVFATNFLSIFCQGVDRGFVDINDRDVWERQVRPGEAEKHRDRINELDSKSNEVEQKGYTPKEKLDMFAAFKSEQQQSQSPGLGVSTQTQQSGSQTQSQSNEHGHDH